MEKNFTTKLKVFVLMLSVYSCSAWAQLSGLYTINSGAPTGGTNFQTFNAFASAINAGGVSGPVMVSVAPGSGPYNEQVTFNNITGTSATNTITIDGNGNTLTFNSTVSAPHVFMLSGTNYMYVTNMVMVGQNATYALVCHLYNQANNNVFSNCTFSCQVNGTSSSQVPVSVSGSATSPSSIGNSGNNNFWRSCNMIGGYYSTCFYGNSVSPYNVGNTVQSCSLLDFYYSAYFTNYVQDHVLKNCILERPNRTTLSTTYAVFINTSSLRTIVDGNHIRNLCTANISNTSQLTCIYIQTSATQNNENIIRNNLISDIRNNGALFGIYVPGYNYNFIYNNTVSLDDQGSTYTGTTYGIYCSTGPNSIKNNIVTIGRGGSGSKYALYYGGGSSIVSNRNVLVLTASAGANYTGYWNANFATLANWQTANSAAYDMNSSNVNPVYTNSVALNYAPTALAINNTAEPLGIVTDMYNVNRSLASPDPGAIEFYTVTCGGLPAANSIITPTAILCPGSTVALNVANTYTNAGYSYQWTQSTATPFGPFTAITGATLTSYTTPPVNVTTYYSAVINCANGSSITAATGTIQIAQTTTSVVPYYESFENLYLNNLPNCSWQSSSATSAVTQTVSNSNGRIPRTGSNFAMFSNASPGTNYFYSNGIQLTAGITYSASLWYITESVGYTNWTDMSILINQSQTATGAATVASTNGAAVSAVYKPLSGTFTVATSGIYYVAIKGTSTTGNAQFLSWDDLRIDIPCSLNGPNMTIALNSTVLCTGQPYNISAQGADSYTWSTGQTGSAIQVMPNLATTGYTVYGKRNLSGCVAASVQPVSINPSPAIFIFASSDAVCEGSSVNLSANGIPNAPGVISYNWSHGVNGPASSVSPTTTTTYSVVGINSFGCSAMDVKQITVNAAPNVYAQSSGTNVCAGDQVTLIGNGAVTYSWVSNTAIMYLGSPLVINPQSSTIFTVTGTDASGCSDKAFITLSVNTCTGIDELQGALSGLKVYPNPNNGYFTIELAGGNAKTVSITDISGRQVLQLTSSDDKTAVDIRNLANGVYYAKVQSGSAVKVVKLVKAN